MNIGDHDDEYIFIPKYDVISEFTIVDSGMIIETSLSALMKNVTTVGNFNSKRRHHSTQALIVDQMKMIPYIGTKSLLVKSLVRSDSGKKYDTHIMFKRVKFVDDIEQVANESDIVEFVGSDDKTYFIERIDMSSHDVAVRCNCLDFRWNAAGRNSKDKSLYGREFKPYKPKTDRPPRNIKNKSMICKHLIKTGSAIAQSSLTTKFKI